LTSDRFLNVFLSFLTCELLIL